MVVALAICAAGWSLAGGHRLFPLLTENGDEGAYLAQADALLHGRIGPPVPHDLVAAFQPWLAAARSGTYVFKYAPVHAAVLAIGDWIASPRLIGAVSAGLAVVLTAQLARDLGATSRQACIAAALLVLSPLFVVQSATMLPYLAGLCLMLGWMLLALRASRRGSRGLALAAGVLLGLGAWSRPFDTLLAALPFAAFLAADARRSGRRVLPTLAAAATGAAPVVVLALVYGWAATGHPLRLPFNVVTTDDTLGFGPRRLDTASPYLDYTPSLAWRAMRENVRLTIGWTAGGLVTVALGVLGFRSTDRVGRAWLVAWAATWIVGYAFFWGSYLSIFGWDGGRFLGPYYYLPVLVPVVVLAAHGLDALVSRSAALAAVAVVLMVAVTAPVAAHAVTSNRARTAKRQSIQRALERGIARVSGGVPVLVLVPPLRGPVLGNPMSTWRNAVEPGPVLYAVDGPDAARAAAAEPDRRVVRVELPEGYPPGDDTTTVPVRVRALDRHRAHAFELDVRSDEAGAVLEARIDGRSMRTALVAGRAELRIEPDGAGFRVTTLDARAAASTDDRGKIELRVVDDTGHTALPRRTVDVARTGSSLVLLTPRESSDGAWHMQPQ